MMEPDRNISMNILRDTTKKELSALLNPVMVIPSKNGIRRYWLGLAGLCELKDQHVANISQNADPTDKVLKMWYDKDPEHSTIQQLLLFLEEMDRYDIIEDITPLIDEDIRIYKENPCEIVLPNLEADKYILTIEDVERIRDGQPLEIYDAFLLYDHEDIEFANQILEIMEKEYGMKLCAKDRDLVGGGLELDKMIKVITERCNRLIVILSDSFFKSSANQYYLSFAHAYGIERERKIIPCTYKQCMLPPEMRFLFILDYRRMVYYNFWSKLKKSIEAPNLIDKSRVNRSHSDNGQDLRSALHENYPNGLKPIIREVKFSSTGDLNNLESQIDQPLNPTTSNDDLRPFSQNNKKQKSSSWIRNILNKNPLKKDHTKVKTKEKRRAAAVAN